MKSLKELYNSVVMTTPGENITYRGFKLEKVNLGGVSPPDHSEVALYNPDGKKVESFTINAFDSYQEFKDRVDEVIDYDPDDMSDWLNR